MGDEIFLDVGHHMSEVGVYNKMPECEAGEKQQGNNS